MNELVPGGNLEALAEQLKMATRDLALLDRTRDDHMYELGCRLIGVRQILQTINGTEKGNTGSDGLRPRGWSAWCKSSGLLSSTASHAIRRAIDPEGHRKKISKKSQDERISSGTFLRQLRRAWPNWTDEGKGAIASFIREQALKEVGHVVG